ncbi:MAG: PH domain-containing protein [Verrucomicrobium sp.]
MSSNVSPVPTAPAESILWKGHSSQWLHFWYYLFCIVLAVACLVGAAFTGGLAAVGLVIPLGLWIVRWWMTKTTHYELTTQRLRKTTGILNRKLDELELYRVKDYSMEQPFMLRVLGLGNLAILTSDASTPEVELRAVADVEGLREKLRQAVQTERDRKRVREMDVDGLGGSAV